MAVVLARKPVGHHARGAQPVEHALALRLDAELARPRRLFIKPRAERAPLRVIARREIPPRAEVLAVECARRFAFLPPLAGDGLPFLRQRRAVERAEPRPGIERVREILARLVEQGSGQFAARHFFREACGLGQPGVGE